MNNYIEFWEFMQPAMGEDHYRYTYVNKDKIESILIKWDIYDKKFVIIIIANDRKYRPIGINIDPDLYMSKEFNKQCYWDSYDAAKKYIEDLMNG